MKSKIKSPQNFWSGLLFLGFGVATIAFCRNYSIGSTISMGPGYFPTAVGCILVVLGAIIAATSLKLEGEGIASFAWRPIILLSVAFAAYGLAVERIGFIPALLLLIVLSAAAGKEFKWKEVLAMSAVLIAGCWVLFIQLLALPLPLFWWR
ncbi:MAG: tripartite tricarboxylate transporter TctB family protein [Deltaproteobacteria bacterium]|nr:tripartite tricarboxylate transporter TctB family protein [Deltaproteobacteria bacterium]